MPLHDHFRAPVRGLAPWTSLHIIWSTALVDQLNQTLPAGYLPLPHVYLGAQAQVDIGTWERAGEAEAAAEGDGAVATAVWAPPQPPLVAPVDLAGVDAVEVRVLMEGDLRLVAAIELVSPANKDRTVNRRAFAAKVAGYLQQQVGVVVVDVVTERQTSLHEELMRLLDLGEPVVTAFTAELYAVAYRAVPVEDGPRLEMWPAGFAVGSALPRLPLWIAAGLAVPLDLEASYRAACERFRLLEDEGNGRDKP